jgi:hypothetical protein
MKNKFVITFNKDHINVISNGDKNYASAVKLWHAIKEECERHNCFHILGIANSEKYFDTMEAYSHAELFSELGINHKYRIAWVELNSEAMETTKFIETVLKNRGLPGRVFSNEEEAKEWLLRKH